MTETTASGSVTGIKAKHLFVSSLIILLGVVFILILRTGLNQNPKAIPSAFTGKKALPFEVEWIQGQDFVDTAGGPNFRLADLKGKPLVLNFWASWCVSCRQEAHYLEEFWRKYKDQDVLIVGIAIQDTQAAAQEFARYYGKTYVLGLDTDGKASIDYGVTGVPETFFINREGIVKHKEAGPVDVPMLEKYLPQIM